MRLLLYQIKFICGLNAVNWILVSRKSFNSIKMGIFCDYFCDVIVPPAVLHKLGTI